MAQHLLDTVKSIPGSRSNLVLGYKATKVKDALIAEKKDQFFIQRQQLGTGHAVKHAFKGLRKNSVSLVLYGDVPLVEKKTLLSLARIANKSCLGVLTFKKKNPLGYGRIIRGESGEVEKIVEEKEASSSQKIIKEVNSGILAIKTSQLKNFVPKINNKNSAKEYYLTDLIAIAKKAGIRVEALLIEDNYQLLGANNQQELHDLERSYQRRNAEKLIAKGINIKDSSRIDIRGELDISRGAEIDVNSVIEGTNKIGKNVFIGPNCYIKDSIIKANSIIRANTVIENSVVGKGCDIGPFARIRGGTELLPGSELGNFVEANRSIIGPGSKAKHLTYLGDAELGKKVNIGAGTITCNYDGNRKHPTKLKDNVFIGSNTSLVAPITVNEGGYTGAGSVITKDVPKGKLAIGRGKQVNLRKKKK